MEDRQTERKKGRTLEEKKPEEAHLYQNNNTIFFGNTVFTNDKNRSRIHSEHNKHLFLFLVMSC